MEATSLAQVDTLYSADSIEFCPHPGFEKWFTCGTYQLLKPDEQAKADVEARAEGANAEEATTVKVGHSDSDNDDDDDAEEYTPPAPRVGRLYLYSLDDTTPTEAQRIETAAILDAKWSPHTPATPELGVADAKGGLSVFSLADGALSLSERYELADEETLVLSLDWSSFRQGEIITSLSDGSLAHVVRRPSGMETLATWHAHEFEPWICAWAGPDSVWSGGDDCKLKRWDVRVPDVPVFVNRRFDAGVTTIAPSPHSEHLLAVGSYDAHLRIFDARKATTPLVDVELPGGIWRTRWHPSAERAGDILNATMHGGFAVVRLPGALATADDPQGSHEAEIIKTFPGTLGYGADWCRRDDGDESVVATCSFYDHVMHVWRA
ncbi:Diphthine methyltransferase [Vanrija pseudolonga]|uniref:methylated diphthine methylhydrolase n=1 Tax=Vanrija pseudolonga TaxID=143232 RepID=A0AAF1BP78_9TREE|nr:Diphthine methyltransferase [Vanrija pseudolonga]